MLKMSYLIYFIPKKIPDIFQKKRLASENRE